MSIIIGALVTAFVSAIGGRIALWRLRVYLDTNKDAIKWGIIYTIFGPPPNAPILPPMPEPRRPFLDWWRGRKSRGYAPWNDTPMRYAAQQSWAERNVGWSGSFAVSLGLIGIPAGLALRAFLGG